MTTAWAGARSSNACSLRPMRDARSPRVIDAASGIARYSSGQLEVGQPRVDRRHPPPQFGARLDRVRLGVHRHGPGEIAARIEDLTDANPRNSIGGVHFDDAHVARKRLIGFSLLRLDLGEIAHEKRAVGRRRDGLLVQPGGLVEAIRLRGPSGGRHILLLGTRAQHFDPPRDRLQLRIRLDGRLEGRQRLGFARERQQRLAAADERRHVAGIRLQHAIEARGRRLEVLSRKIEIAHRRVARIELRRPLEDRLKSGLGAPEIAGLEPAPRGIVFLKQIGLRADRAETGSEICNRDSAAP